MHIPVATIFSANTWTNFSNYCLDFSSPGVKSDLYVVKWGFVVGINPFFKKKSGRHFWLSSFMSEKMMQFYQFAFEVCIYSNNLCE